MGLLPSGAYTKIEFMNEVILCTGFSFTENNTLIESSAGYGAAMNSTYFGSPHVRNYGEVSGSFSYNPILSQAESLLDWVSNRNTLKTLKYTTSGSGTNTYDEVLFNSIGLEVNEGEVISADVGFAAYDRPYSTGTIGGSTIAQQTSTTMTTLKGNTMMPFWKTQVTGVPANTSVIGWNLTISQDLITKYFCDDSSNTTADPPDYVFVGPLSVNLGLSLVLPTSVALSTFLYDYSGTVAIKYGATTLITLYDLSTETNDPSIVESGGYLSTELSLRSNHFNIP